MPDSLQSIPAYAFAGCTGLEKIWIPEGIEPQYDEEGNQTSFVPIASTAFNDVSTSTLTIHGVSGSYAETFADEKGYPFVAEAFEYTPATLSGTVTDAAGNPLSGVTVTVYKGPTTNYPFGSTTTDSSGAWTMENVKVGSYYGVGFEKEGYTFSPDHPKCTAVPADGYIFDDVIGGTTSDTRSGFAVSHGTTNGLVAGAGGGRGMTITVVSTNDWTVESDSDWITLSVSGGKSEETFYPTIAENTRYESRTGYITVRCDGYTPAIIRVVQNAAARTASIAVHTPDERSVTDNSAVVTGMLTWGDGESAASYQNVGIQYGLDDGSDWIATISAELDSESGKLITTVGELTTGVVYRFRAVAQHVGTLEWMESEPVSARIQAYCEHQYGDMIYAYDDSVQAYHDRYIADGNTFLPTIYVDEEETAETHSVRHPYICVCSLCDRFEVIYSNGITEHNFETITETVYENITDDTHDVYQIARVMCTTALNDVLCGHIQNEEKVLVEEGTAHTFIDGVCVCGECNVVWNAAMSGNLNIGVSVKSGHPDADKNYLFIAEDDQGLHYSATIPAGSVSRTFGVKSDLGLLRAKTYAIYILPEGISLTDDNREEYYVCDIAVPLFNGKMVTSVYSGDTELRDKNKVYVDDVIRINWDGSYGVEHAQVVVKLNNTVVVNETYNYSGPGTITLDSATLGAVEGDTLTVTVTVDPNAVATADVLTTRAATVQPVSYSWTGTFETKPVMGYVIERIWDGETTDVTNQKCHMTTVTGKNNYFGLRAKLDGETLNLTDSGNGEYEWRLSTGNVVLKDDWYVGYAYDLTENPKTGYFMGWHDDAWIIKTKKDDGYTFYFNDNIDGLKGSICLYKLATATEPEELVAYVVIQGHNSAYIVTGADVGYSSGSREYNAAVSLPANLISFWESPSTTPAQKRLWFDLNFKPEIIKSAIPSHNVEAFVEEWDDDLRMRISNGAVNFTLTVGDTVGNALSDVCSFVLTSADMIASIPDGDISKTLALMEKANSCIDNGEVVQSLTNTEQYKEAVIAYLKTEFEKQASNTGHSTFQNNFMSSAGGSVNTEKVVLVKDGVEVTYDLMDLIIDTAESNAAITDAKNQTDIFSLICKDPITLGECSLGDFPVYLKYGDAVVDFKLEELFDVDRLTEFINDGVFDSDQYGRVMGYLTGGTSFDDLTATEKNFLWSLWKWDSKDKVYNTIVPDSRMMENLDSVLEKHHIDDMLSLFSAGINGYSAWHMVDNYDTILREFEEYLTLSESQGGLGITDEEWVNVVLDELAAGAAEQVEKAFTAMVSSLGEDKINDWTSDAINKVLAEAFPKVASKAACVIGVVTTAIDLTNMIANTSNTYGKMPTFEKTFELYKDAQENLYAALDDYASNPNNSNYATVERCAKLYNVLKGSCIVCMYNIYTSDLTSIEVMFWNWVKYEAKLVYSFWECVFTNDSSGLASLNDPRKEKLSQIEAATEGELQQMESLMKYLFPFSY